LIQISLAFSQHKLVALSTYLIKGASLNNKGKLTVNLLDGERLIVLPLT
jgi:hypothetical protein